MRIFNCPACQGKGSVPDNFAGGRIKCPRCGCRFEVPGAAAGNKTTQTLGTVPKAAPAKAAAPKTAPAKPATTSSVFDDLASVESEGIAVEPLRAASPVRRAASGAGHEPVGKSKSPQGLPPLAYLGIGGGVLAAGALVFVIANAMKGGSNGPGDVAWKDQPTLNMDAPEPEVATPSGGSSATETTASAAPVVTPPVALAAMDHEAIVAKLKAATAYIKVKVNGKPHKTGTGFAIEIIGDKVLVATNRHVALVNRADLPPDVDEKNLKVELEVVFNSGEGPKEIALPGHVVAADTSEDMNRDLAFLVVEGVSKPPTPLLLSQAKVPNEGTAYTAAGFPGGQMTSMITGSRGNPTIVITSGLISSLRRDDYGQLAVVQVDGALNPGNSGGPLVDGKTGALIGVAVAKLNAEATGAESTGFAIPASQVTRALEGRVGNVDMTVLSPPTSIADIEIKAELVDPKGKLKDVAIYAVPASSLTSFSPNPDGTWSQLPNTNPLVLKTDPKTHEATGRFQVPLSGQGKDGRKVTFQAAYRNQKNELTFDRPITVELPEKGGRIGGSFAKVIEALRKRSYAKLGPLIDPDEACRMTKDDQTFKISISAPGKKVFSLSPELTLKKNTPVHNAPRTLADVTGDFAAIVRVTGDINPGVEPIKDPKGIRNLPITFQGAGLLLYEDKDNFMRVERSSRTEPGGATLIEQLTIEVVRDGKQAVHPIYAPVPEGDMTIVMIRRKGRIQCLVSPDNRMLILTQELAFDWPETVKVGLTVCNLSRKAFDANFEEFVIVDDKTTLDQDFNFGGD